MRLIFALLAALTVATVAAPVVVSKPHILTPAGGSGGGGTLPPGEESLIATHTILNTSTLAIASTPYTGGQPFARGEIPGCLIDNTPKLKSSTGVALVTQLDEVSKWYDGSCRHVVFSTFLPAMAGSATEKLQFFKTPGAYTVGTDNRTTADVTATHDYKMVFSDIRRCAFTGDAATGTCNYQTNPVGGGTATASLNQMIADGTVEIVATGPVRRSLVVHGAAIHATPLTTALGAAITSGTTGSVLVASTASFPATGTYMLKIDGEYILATTADATHISITARGAGGSTAASHSSGATATNVAGTNAAHLWLRWYVDIYTNPANPAQVYGISHMPLIMAPWENVVGLDQYSYFASFNDGATLIRDHATTMTATQSSGVNITTGYMTFDATAMQRSECVSLSSTGTLPTGFVADRPYFLSRATTGAYRMFAYATLPAGNTNWTLPTATGSGTMTAKRRICHPYRNGWFSAADDDGNPNWSIPQPTLRPQLTLAERIYWQETGLVPPYKTNLAPVAFVPDPASDSNGFYRPNIAVHVPNSINAGGQPPNVGQLPQWVAWYWMRQDATGWRDIHTAALGKVHWPMSAILNEKTGRLIPINNGPDRAGASYPGLGAPQRGVQVSIQVPFQGVISPALGGNNGTRTNNWGVMNHASGNGPNSHRSLDPYFPFLLTGKRYFLDVQHMDSALALMIPSIGTTTNDGEFDYREARHNNTGTTYYAKIIFGKSSRASGNGFKTVIGGSVIGAESSPERQYLNDVVDENLDFFEAFQAANTTAQKAVGSIDIGSVGGEGLTTMWHHWSELFGYGATRKPKFLPILEHHARFHRARYDDRVEGISAHYAAEEYWAIFKSINQPFIYGGTLGNWVTNFAETRSDIGIGSFGDTQNRLSFTGSGSAAITIAQAWIHSFMQDGDPIMPTGNVFNTGNPGSFITTSVPPEVTPESPTSACPNQRLFYMRNPSPQDNAAGQDITIDGLACTPTGPVIPIAVPKTGVGYVTYPTYSSVTGTSHYATQPINANSFPAIMIGNMCHLRKLGIANLDYSINQALARSQIPDAGSQGWEAQAQQAISCGSDVNIRF